MHGFPETFTKGSNLPIEGLFPIDGLALPGQLASKSLEHPILKNMAREFQQRQAGASPQEVLLLLAGVVLAFWLVWLLGQVLASEETRYRTPRPRRLFHELCRAHRLTRSQSALLWNFARSLGLSDPVRVFVDPQCFQSPEVTLSHRDAEQLRKIEDIIFAGLKNEPSTDSES
jgi:hypothetical protein